MSPNKNEKGSSKKETVSFCQEQLNLAEIVGNFIHYWGFKKIHGQIWCAIYLSTSPLSAADLMARQPVSKASISLALKDLMGYQLISEEKKDHRGYLTYRANPDLVSVILTVLRTREKKLLAEALTAQTLLNEIPAHEKDLCKINQERLDSLGRFIGVAQKSLNSMINLGEFSLKNWKDIPFT